MKNRFEFPSLGVIAVIAAPILSGCTQQSAGTKPSYVTTSSPAPVVTQVVPVMNAAAPQQPQSAAPEPAVATAPPLVITNAPGATEPVFPPNLRISQPLYEVIKLAQSGVDEAVILTYVTNSIAIFTLGAEEIVYLTDIGVPNNVISAMMQRDQTLRAAYANAAPPVPATNEPPAAVAPTYVAQPQPVAYSSPETVVVSDNYFYDTLSPYGTWVQIDGYGRCWRPTVAVTVPTWQPYRDRGRWIHTDAGWYWMSDYSWGSVAFHYGRWFNHARWGWCWWPDRVWAPSWVTWRYDAGHCGWAPLPPNSIYTPGVGFTYFGRSVGLSFDFGLHAGAFTFVPWNRFCDPYPDRYCLPRHRTATVYNQSTVVNNVVIGEKNRVNNRGIAKDRVATHTGAEIRTVNIREDKPRTYTRGERLERDGRTLVVERPDFRTPPQAASAEPRQKNPRVDSSRDLVTRPMERPTPTPAKTTPTIAPSVTSSGPVATPQPRKSDEDRNTIRTRDNRAAVVRLPETEKVAPAPATSTPARSATPIFSKPVIVERPAYTPSHQVIGGLPENQTQVTRPTAPTTTWTPRTTQTRPSVSAPSFNNSSARSRTIIQPAPTPSLQNDAPIYTPPSVNRPNFESRREPTFSRPSVSERSIGNQPARGTIISPAPRVSAPTPAVNNPTPRPVITPTPAPVAPRVESRPAAPARSDSRPDSGSRSR